MSNTNSSNDPLDFTRNLWEKMGFSLPGMVTPTLDIDELEKRLADLKAVEGWLKMNLSMLQLTIQGLDMQCTTLKAVREIGHLKADSAVTPDAPENAAQQASSTTSNPAEELQTMWPWAVIQKIQTQMQERTGEPAAKSTPKEKTPAKPGKKKT